jgi:hypothetical protein
MKKRTTKFLINTCPKRKRRTYLLFNLMGFNKKCASWNSYTPHNLGVAYLALLCTA